jgi:transketolase
MFERSTQPFGPGWKEHAARVASGIRCRVLEHTLRNNGGYLSQACSSAEALAALYSGIMWLKPSVAPLLPLPFPGVPGRDNPGTFTGAGYNGPHEPELDRFFFSPVHYALVLYSALIETGRLSPDALRQFNRDGSSVELIGAEHSPGHEVTAGSLGQCISQAGGIALARRLKGESGRNFVFMSDGEFQEGQVWEAFAALAWYRLDNVAVYVDVNGQQCDGRMDPRHAAPIAERLAAFGAHVHVVDGHDLDALAAPVQAGWSGAPLVVLAATDPCRGMDLLRSRGDRLHYVRFKNEQEMAAYQSVLDAMRRDP